MIAMKVGDGKLSSLNLWQVVVPWYLSMSEVPKFRESFIGWVELQWGHEPPGVQNRSGNHPLLRCRSGCIEQQFDFLFATAISNCGTNSWCGKWTISHLTLYHGINTFSAWFSAILGVPKCPKSRPKSRPGFGLLPVRWILWLPLHLLLFAVPCVWHWRLRVLREPALLVAKPGLPGGRGGFHEDFWSR